MNLLVMASITGVLFYLSGVLSKIYKKDFNTRFFFKSFYFYIGISIIYFIISIFFFQSALDNDFKTIKAIEDFKQLIEVVSNNKSIGILILLTAMYGLIMFLAFYVSILNLWYLLPLYFLLGARYKLNSNKSFFYIVYVLGWTLINLYIVYIVVLLQGRKNIDFYNHKEFIVISVLLFGVGYYIERKNRLTITSK